MPKFVATLSVGTALTLVGASSVFAAATPRLDHNAAQTTNKCPYARLAATAGPTSTPTVQVATEGSLRVVRRAGGPPPGDVSPNSFVVVSYPPCPIGHDGWVSFTSGLGSIAVKWTFGTLNEGDVSTTYTGNCQYAQGCLWYGVSPSNAQWYLKSAIISGIGVVFDAKGCD